jgi:hypothetical protein
MDPTAVTFSVGALTVGVVSLLKMMFPVPSHFAPALGVVVGVIFTVLVNIATSGGQFSVEVTMLLNGLITGLVSNGLYDNTLGLKKEE